MWPRQARLPSWCNVATKGLAVYSLECQSHDGQIDPAPPLSRRRKRDRAKHRELIDGHEQLAHRKRPGDRHDMPRTFVIPLSLSHFVDPIVNDPPAPPPSRDS
jgi:hypothetical protein